MRPSSMYSSRLCCCLRLKYCISSKYSRMPDAPNIPPVSARIALTSASEAVVALSLWNAMPDAAAMTEAAVVLPVPGGP